MASARADGRNNSAIDLISSSTSGLLDYLPGFVRNADCVWKPCRPRDTPVEMTCWSSVNVAATSGS